MRQLLAIPLAIAIAACGAVPRDPEGTLDHVRDTGEIRVGIIDDAADVSAQDQARRLIGRIETRTDARAVIEHGGAARLLPLLETGELDLVIGRFDQPSPWKRRVSIATPIAWPRLPPDLQRYAAATRNGENAWTTIVENESNAIAEPRP